MLEDSQINVLEGLPVSGRSGGKACLRFFVPDNADGLGTKLEHVGFHPDEALFQPCPKGLIEHGLQPGKGAALPEQLRLFSSVARTRSMSKTAQEMNITQSAVSQSIARLEQELGVRLFLREKRRLILQESGEKFYTHVISILRELNEARQDLSRLQSKVSGVLRLQVFAASALIPRLLYEFSNMYPDVRYQMIRHKENSDFDLCIDYAPEEGMPTESDLLLDEEVLIAVPPSHPLAVRSSILLRELQNDNFILMRSGTVLRRLTNRVCSQAGFEPRVVFESDNPSTVRSMISMGLGVAFVPEVSWHNVADRNIVLLHVSNPPCRRRLCIYPWRRAGGSPAVEAFREYAISYFERTKKAVVDKKEK